MEVINNLPVILAASAAFIAGLYGYLNGMPRSRVYQSMCLFLIAFYIVGTFIKFTTKKIWEENEEKLARLSSAGAEPDSAVFAAGEDASGEAGKQSGAVGAIESGDSGDASAGGDAAGRPADYAVEEDDGAEYGDAGYDADGYEFAGYGETEKNAG